MCFVQGLIFGILANSSAALLSLKVVQIMIGYTSIIFVTGVISDINVLMGNTSLAAVDKAIYSASDVLRAISDCNLLNHVMGQLPYMMTQPDLHLTPLGSS